MEYEHRIVCFIDILDFKNIIKETIDTDGKDIVRKIDEVESLLNFIREILDIDNPNEFSKSKRVTQFSDSIVISFLVDERSEIFHTLLDILHLSINFVIRGILLRGAIAYGKIIHTNQIIFGPGMITAYETESKAALYPRIILDQTVIEIAKIFPAIDSDPKNEEESILEIVTQDTDNMYYIDYISKGQSELDDPDDDMPMYISKINEIIENNLHFESPDIKVKIGWLLNKYNLLIESATSTKHIKSLNEMERSDLANYYLKLKKILN